jgi:hypothetical protein
MALRFSHGLRIKSGKSERQSVAQPDECAMKTASGVREFHLELAPQAEPWSDGCN